MTPLTCLTLVGTFGRLGLAGPILLCSICQSSWTSFLCAQGIKNKCSKRWGRVTVNLWGLGLILAQVTSTPFCWLTQLHSSCGSKRGDISFISLHKECQRISGHFLLHIYYMYVFSFLFWPVGKMGVVD